MLGFCICFEPCRNLWQHQQSSLFSPFRVQLARHICLEYVLTKAVRCACWVRVPPMCSATHTCGSAAGVFLSLTSVCNVSVTALKQVRWHRIQWLMLLSHFSPWMHWATCCLCWNEKGGSYAAHAHCNHDDTVTAFAFQLILFKLFLSRIIYSKNYIPQYWMWLWYRGVFQPCSAGKWTLHGAPTGTEPNTSTDGLSFMLVFPLCFFYTTCDVIGQVIKYGITV